MRKWYPWVIAASALLFSLAVFNRLPARIPLHWDVRGVATGSTSRLEGALLVPVILVLMALILPRLPALDPKRANYEKFRPTYDLIVGAVTTAFAALHVAALGTALGWPISMARLTPLLVGGLFIVLGNVMPRARQNWIFGIRTPWTLKNERVWERTHRVGGYVFVAGGVAVMLLAVVPAVLVTPMMVTTLTIVAVTPLTYSYLTWKRETSR